jgi:hypothetical protein
MNWLINSLRTYGIKADQAIERANTSSFLLNADSILEVRANGVTLIIYEYTNDTLKGIDASLLSPDGSTYTAKGQVIVEDYAAPPAMHFYNGPNIILKYVGNNSKIISSLEMLYGNQFAGS